MRKYTQITIVISVLIFLVWLRNATFTEDEAVITGVRKNNSTGTSTNQNLSKDTLTPTPVTNGSASGTDTTTSDVSQSSEPTTAPSGQYKDGTYTGSVTDAFYGNVQVQAVISNGQISNVIFLQFPNHSNTSININSQAMPLLIEEAIAAQSADVSGVSGASATSPAFKSSLASALSQAKN